MGVCGEGWERGEREDSFIYVYQLTPFFSHVTLGGGLPDTIQSNINGSPALMMLVCVLLMMTGAMGGSERTVTMTENSTLPARF